MPYYLIEPILTSFAIIDSREPVWFSSAYCKKNLRASVEYLLKQASEVFFNSFSGMTWPCSGEAIYWALVTYLISLMVAQKDYFWSSLNRWYSANLGWKDAIEKSSRKNLIRGTGGLLIPLFAGAKVIRSTFWLGNFLTISGQDLANKPTLTTLVLGWRWVVSFWLMIIQSWCSARSSKKVAIVLPWLCDSAEGVILLIVDYSTSSVMWV